MAAATIPRIPGLAYVGPLGQGSAAVVLRYRHTASSRIVAVKISKAHDVTAARLVRHEAAALTQLSGHPSILTIRGSGATDDGRFYFISDWHSGGSLADLIRRKPPDCRQTISLGIGISQALSIAHHAGILHHDIKPSNILIDAHGAPVLADFGVATDLYGLGPAGGSLPWSPPEVLRGETAREPADIYALAATLWAALRGHSPFEYGRPCDEHELARRILHGDLPASEAADMPPILDAALRRALAVDPNARPQSAHAFEHELQEARSILLPTHSSFTRSAFPAPTLPPDPSESLEFPEPPEPLEPPTGNAVQPLPHRSAPRSARLPRPARRAFRHPARLYLFVALLLLTALALPVAVRLHEAPRPADQIEIIEPNLEHTERDPDGGII